MNIAKIMLLCAVLVFAQHNALRGFAYNPYETLGAAPTIADILQKPSDIHGHEFVYVSPKYGSGYSAFDLAGGSALLGFDQSFLGFNQSLILGYAKSFYGLLLKISPYRLCNRSYDDVYKCSSNQNFGLNFSMPLGSSIFYAYTGKTIQSDYGNDNDDILNYKYESSAKEAYIGITGGNALVWDFRLGFDRYKTSHSGYGYGYNFIPYEFDFSNYETNTEFLFNFGYKILQSDRLRFIIGSNNGFLCQYYSNSYNDASEYHLQAVISPNFLGEAALTKHLLAFVGASYNIYSYILLSKNDDTEDDAKIETFSIQSYMPGTYAGLRYEYKNWAIETRLQNDVFGEIFSGRTPFIRLGVFFFFQQ